MPDVFSLIKLASEPNRLRILSLLREKDLCVCELEGILGISQPLVSAHLRTLKKAGLISDRQEGKWVYFFLNPKTWKTENAWLSPLMKRAAEDKRLLKDKSLLSDCLCERVNGKCINRFRPSRS